MQGFERFWLSWPRSTRKGAKAACLKVWEKNYCETCLDQIIKHVEWMKTTDDWRKNNGAFIPAPLVYLNQQRWDGAEVPELAKPPTVLDQRAIWAAEDARAAKPSPEIVARLKELRGLRN
jgi:hypothetical protein